MAVDLILKGAAEAGLRYLVEFSFSPTRVETFKVKAAAREYVNVAYHSKFCR